MHLVFNPKTGEVAMGSREEIVNRFLNWGFENGVLFAKKFLFKKQFFHSYSSQWAEEEKKKDAIKFLFNHLLSYGFRHFCEDIRKID
jgi:hypothetical protein